LFDLLTGASEFDEKSLTTTIVPIGRLYSLIILYQYQFKCDSPKHYCKLFLLCLLNCIEKNSKDDENRTSPITGWEVALFSDSERYDENVIAEIKSKEVSLLCDLRYIVYIFSNINCA